MQAYSRNRCDRCKLRWVSRQEYSSRCLPSQNTCGTISYMCCWNWISRMLLILFGGTRCWRLLNDNPKWRHLYRFFWCTLSPKARIVGIDNLSEEGMQQGDPAVPVGFCIALHSHAVWAHEQLQKVGGCVIMDMDDGYFLGPIEALMEVVGQFQNRMVEQVVSVLQPSKCEVWCHSSIRKRVQDCM